METPVVLTYDIYVIYSMYQESCSTENLNYKMRIMSQNCGQLTDGSKRQKFPVDSDSSLDDI